jgi:hypothetical protein
VVTTEKDLVKLDCAAVPQPVCALRLAVEVEAPERLLRLAAGRTWYAEERGLERR